MKALKIATILVFSFFFIVMFIGSLSDTDPDTTKYKGASINDKWDNRSVCQTARYLIKKSGTDLTKTKTKEFYDQPCTVSKVTAPLPGKFAGYDPYSVSWPNGVAARVFVTREGLRMSGFSNDGVPQSWYK